MVQSPLCNFCNLELFELVDHVLFEWPSFDVALRANGLQAPFVIRDIVAVYLRGCEIIHQIVH